MTHVTVTGDSGGVGGAICRTLVSHGYDVLGIDSEDNSETRWKHVQMDLADPIPVDALNLGEFASTNAIIHCAAVQPTGRVGEIGSRAFTQSTLVNCASLDALVGARLRNSTNSSLDVVIAVGSVHSSVTSAGLAAYAASKAALRSWVRSAAIELSPETAVFYLQLGAVNSPKLSHGLTRFADPQAALDRLQDRLPTRELISPSEVGEVCLSLLRPAWRHATGSEIALDGGISLVLASELDN